LQQKDKFFVTVLVGYEYINKNMPKKAFATSVALGHLLGIIILKF